MGWEDTDAFGGSDPFAAASADCFGQTVEDVDPFLNDSFGGDKEWNAFNTSDDEHDFGFENNENENRNSDQSKKR